MYPTLPRRVRPEASWLAEAARTNLWLVPTGATLGAAGLFCLTRGLDSAAYRHGWHLPSWIIVGSADGARQILTTLAAALITVVGVVFSIILVALTLTSTQFGPRMLRNFIRDRGTQWTLGAFVATFVYAMLDLVTVGGGPDGDFVPHISITVVLVLTMADVGVLIYFIHHVAVMIQLPEVIAAIARDLAHAVEQEADQRGGGRAGPGESPEVALLRGLIGREGAVVHAPESGYLQLVRRSMLVDLAVEHDAVIELHHRPGHFVVRGQPFLTIWPGAAAPEVERWLRRSHITGPHRTLTQDVAFAVDQLVEIAIRALSPAVNDTFTALTCIDWLGESLCRIARDWDPDPVCRDERGLVRLITAPVSYERLVQRAHEKIRQAAAGMPAVLIRQLDALVLVARSTRRPERLPVLLAQAEMIHRLAAETVQEKSDLEDIGRVYRELLDLASHRVEP